jgi:hypothetical protein
MLFWVYDDEGRLFRKFAFKDQATKFLQPGWQLVMQPKPRNIKPTIETHGKALW